PAAHQAGPQALARLSQSARHGSLLPAQFARGLRFALAFETAEHERRTQLLRQLSHLRIQQRLQLAQRRLHDGLLGFTGRLRIWMSLPSRRRLASAQGRALRDGMQPADERNNRPQRSRLPRQHQEYRLKGILGVLLMAQYVSADIMYH